MHYAQASRVSLAGHSLYSRIAVRSKSTPLDLQPDAASIGAPGSLKSRIGVRVPRSTASATLPRTRRPRPLRPCEFITIRSGFWGSAASIATRPEVLLGLADRIHLRHHDVSSERARLRRSHQQNLRALATNEFDGLRERHLREGRAIQRHEHRRASWCASHARGLHAHRHTSTGILLCVSTFVVSLPRSSPATPFRPCDAMQIKSHSRAAAVSMIAAYG